MAAPIPVKRLLLFGKKLVVKKLVSKKLLLPTYTWDWNAI
jgi:hypothetical protein